MKKIFLIIVLFLNILSVSAVEKAEATMMWQQANEAYTKGNYVEALAIYNRLEKEVGISASLYYNIGNCYFKENRLGKAIIYFNRAQRLDPSNEDISHNLAVANALTSSKINEVPKFFLYSWLEKAANIMSSDSWAQVSIIFLAVLLSMLIAFLLSRKSNRRKITFSIGIAALVITLLAGMASTYQRNVQLSDEQGVIMNNAVAVKSSPDDSGKDIFVLNEGVKVEIKEQVGKWSKITIASGDTGWVITSNIEII